MDATPRTANGHPPGQPDLLAHGPSFLDRGRALTIVAESCCLLAWSLGGLALVTGTDLGLIALILGLVGLILVAIAFFLFARLGRLSLAAGWVQAGGLALGLILFIAIPSGREWGKLAAFILAFSGLGVTNAVAHILAGLGLRQGGFPASGLIALVASIAALVCGLLAVLWQSEVLHVAVALSIVAHAAVLAGAIAPHPKVI